MAVIANQFDPNKQESQQQTDASQPVNVSGSAAAPTGSSGPSATKTNPTDSNPTATNSGQFTNLKSYLNANSGYNKDNGGLAGQMTQKFQNQYNDVNNNLNQAYNQFDTQAKQNSVQYDPNFVSQTLQNPYQYTTQADTAATSQPANTGTQQQQTDPYAQWNQYLNAQYKGPTAIDQDGQVKNQVNNYQNYANQAQTEAGRFSLLKNMFDNGNYSQGAQTLDNLFLQDNPDQQAALQGFTTQANALGNQYNQQVNNATTEAQNLTKQAQDTQDATRKALTDTINQYDPNGTYVQGLVSGAQQDRGKKFNTLQTDLTNNAPTDQELKDLGLTRGIQTYGANAGDFLKYAESDPASYQNVLSGDDFNKVQALAKLAGSTGIGSNVTAAYGDSSKAGTYQDQPLYTFNGTGPGGFFDRVNAGQQGLDQYNSIKGNEALAQVSLGSSDNAIKQRAQDQINSDEAQMLALQKLYGNFGSLLGQNAGGSLVQPPHETYGYLNP